MYYFHCVVIVAASEVFVFYCALKPTLNFKLGIIYWSIVLTYLNKFNDRSWVGVICSIVKANNCFCLL